MERPGRIRFGGQTEAELSANNNVLTVGGERVTREELLKKIEANLRKGRERKEGEAPKKIEEIEYVGLMSSFLDEERRRLGLEPGYIVELERVHLFYGEDWVPRAHDGHQRSPLRCHRR